MTVVSQKEEHNRARAFLTVYCAIFGIHFQHGVMVCLIKRFMGEEKGKWALPSGPVICDDESGTDETLLEAAYKGLRLNADLGEGISLRQFHAKENIDLANPKLKTVSVGYYGLIETPIIQLHTMVKRQGTQWWAVSGLPEIVLNHVKEVEIAYTQMKKDMLFHPIFRELLPLRFVLSELQMIFEKIFECTFDKSNFRKKILESGLVEELDEFQSGVGHRGGRLYKFPDKIDSLMDPLGLAGFITSFLPVRYKKFEFSK